MYLFHIYFILHESIGRCIFRSRTKDKIAVNIKEIHWEGIAIDEITVYSIYSLLYKSGNDLIYLEVLLSLLRIINSYKYIYIAQIPKSPANQLNDVLVSLVNFFDLTIY